MMNLEDAEKQKLQLAKKIAQINAAMASFVSAYSDREKPDRATAELALRTITELVPEVARDAKTLSASMDPDSRNQFLQQIQALCQASKDVCATAETEGVNAAVRKFSNASEKLVFTLTPREDGAKGQQMLDLASSACDKASQLLSNVHQLANIVEGVNGQDLDCKGVRVVDKAQALLAAAQVTGPTITEPRCQSSLLSTVDDLSSSSQQLADSWRKVPPSPYHQPLETELQELEKILDKMRKGCQSPPPGATKMMMPMVSPQEMQRLKYVRTVSRAKKNLQAADDELNKPDICLLMRQEDADKMQKQLQQRLEELNAAVAALLATSQDRSNPDYVATEEAVSTISELVPQVAKDSKTLSSSMDAESRDKFLAKVRALCDASKDVCSSAESGKGLEPAASKFADASGRLAFTISPKSGTSNEQQVVDLSSAACDKAAQLLFNVQQLSQQVGGDAGEHLDRKGVDVCNSAQAILVASQNWGPNISDPRARSELLSAVDSLSSSGQDLAKNWRQVPKGPRHQVLEKDLQELEKILGQLRGACESAADDQVKKVAEVKRLQFVKSAADAKRNLQAADDELNKPVIPAPLNQEDVVNKQHRLHQHLEDLNAAIAALMASTADSSKPDYVAAEKSVDTINKLLPEVVKDAKALGASQEPSSRDALLKQVRALCDASRDVCASAETGQDLSGSASKFANASGRLAFVVSPKTNTSREQQVLDLSAAACGTAAQLLSNVQQLSQEVGGDAGVALDRKGAKVADDSKALLEVAQNPALISDPAKQESIQSTVDALSSSTQDLASTWRRLPAGPHNHTLERSLQDLEKILGQLRGTCQSAIDDDVKKAAEIKRMQFVKSAASARRNLQAADDELNKQVIATAPLSQADIVQKRNRLQEHIAVLSAAIAALLASTTDRSRSDYTTAEQSVDTISKLTTEVVKDAKSLGMTQDSSTREKLMKHVRTLCDASKDVCASAERGQGLSESASKFADASGKLIFVVSPNTNTSKEQQVLDLSTAACGTASQLLSNVQQLSQQIGGDTGMALDKKGAKAADDAKALLETAEKSAPTISDPGSQKSILSSVDALLGLSQDLANTWRQVPAGSRHQVLERELQDLERILGQLREACRSAGDQAAKDDVQRLKFVKTVGATKQSLKTADEELKKPAPTTPLTQEAAVDMQHQVQQELGQMSGAIAALVTATADRSLPDYATAEQSLGVVSLLLPLIIKDAKTLSPNQEPAGREALAERVQALCQASKDVCASAETGEGLSEAASRYANASGKLVYVINPRVDVAKGQQVLDLSAVACGTASQLLANVQHLTQQVSGPVAEDLDRKGATVADNAQALLTVAQVQSPRSVQRSPSASRARSAPHRAPKPRGPPPAVPRRNPRASIEITQEFLHTMRLAEDHAAEEKYRQQFLKAVDNAGRTIGCAENNLKEVYKSKSQAAGPKLSANQQAKKQKEMEEKLALANVNVAALVGANYADKIDFNTASKSINELPQLLSGIVEDGKSLSTSFTDKARQAFLDDMLQYCETTRTLCDTAKNDRQKLKEAAVNFGDKSARILYTVSSEADHDLEKQIISTAKDIGDSTSRLAAAGARLAPAPSPAAAAALDSTGALLYTAKKMSENSDLPVGVRHEYAQYCDAIRSAVGDVDDASLEARRAPHDINKYRELENAIQNLQMVILQNRPNRDGKGADNRIVDLREYIEDVAAEADKIIEIANYVETKQSKKPLEHIKEECQKIKSGASNSLAPAQYYGDDARDNDFEIDSFAQECESRVSDIGSHMRALEDDKASVCPPPQRRAPPPPPKPWARWRVCRAAQGAAQGAAHAPAPAPLAAYAAQELLIHLMKLLTVVTSKRVAMWQPTNDLELATISDQILQELEKPESGYGSSEHDHSILTPEYTKKLLSPNQKRPDHQSSKMKLLEAVRQLNHSVNELTRVTCPANKLQQECEELNRTLQLQHSTLQATPRPACTNVYKDCVDALNSQQDVVDKLKNDSPMPRKQFVEEMGYITTAVCNSSDYAAQCAYLISISDENKAAAKEGLVDTHKLQKWLGTVEDTCVSLMHSANVENMKEEDRNLKRQVESLSEMLEESSGKVPDRSVRARLLECRDEVNTSADAVSRAVDALDGHALCSDGEAQIRKLTMGLLSALNKTESLVEDPVLQPQVSSIHPDTQAKSDEVLNNCKTLISKTQALVKQVKSSPETDEEMTWVMFKVGRDQVLESFEALLKSIR
ncbi:hypothetical protein O3G_MSEX011537 [Manduca sexta]|uniref:Talin central domain-containing protein n=1 Tax=Manduca sexta TaxID=7130 RepID=A0A921ZKS3_MANSE|nr:hypothetical protein O3G_MSEX011537 [Manduca sexta]